MRRACLFHPKCKDMKKSCQCIGSGRLTNGKDIVHCFLNLQVAARCQCFETLMPYNSRFSSPCCPEPRCGKRCGQWCGGVCNFSREDTCHFQRIEDPRGV